MTLNAFASISSLADEASSRALQPVANPALGTQGLFDEIARHNLSKGQFLLTGSFDQSVIAAVRTQIEQAERLSGARGIAQESDELARLAGKLISADGAVKIQTIELDAEAKQAAQTFTEVLALHNDGPLPSRNELRNRDVADWGASTPRNEQPAFSGNEKIFERAAMEPNTPIASPLAGNRETAARAAVRMPLAENAFVNVRGPGMSVPVASFPGAFSNGVRFHAETTAIAQLPAAMVFGSNQPLTGNRTFSAASLTAGGLVSPGNSPGKINIEGDFTLLSSSVLLIELEGTATGIDHDIVNVGGTATLGSSRLDLTLLGAFQARVQPTDSFTVLLAGTAGPSGQLVGAFGNIANGGRLLTTDGLGSFQVNYGPNSAFSPKNVVLSNFAAVPEPSTWALMGGGALAMALALRRKRAKVSTSDTTESL